MASLESLSLLPELGGQKSSLNYKAEGPVGTDYIFRGIEDVEEFMSTPVDTTMDCANMVGHLHEEGWIQFLNQICCQSSIPVQPFLLSQTVRNTSTVNSTDSCALGTVDSFRKRTGEEENQPQRSAEEASVTRLTGSKLWGKDPGLNLYSTTEVGAQDMGDADEYDILGAQQLNCNNKKSKKETPDEMCSILNANLDFQRKDSESIPNPDEQALNVDADAERDATLECANMVACFHQNGRDSNQFLKQTWCYSRKEVQPLILDETVKSRSTVDSMDKDVFDRKDFFQNRTGDEGDQLQLSAGEASGTGSKLCGKDPCLNLYSATDFEAPDTAQGIPNPIPKAHNGFIDAAINATLDCSNMDRYFHQDGQDSKQVLKKIWCSSSLGLTLGETIINTSTVDSTHTFALGKVDGFQNRTGEEEKQPQRSAEEASGTCSKLWGKDPGLDLSSATDVGAQDIGSAGDYGILGAQHLSGNNQENKEEIPRKRFRILNDNPEIQGKDSESVPNFVAQTFNADIDAESVESNLPTLNVYQGGTEGPIRKDEDQELDCWSAAPLKAKFSDRNQGNEPDHNYGLAKKPFPNRDDPDSIEQQDVNLEIEKIHIIKRMLGMTSTIDKLLESDATFFVQVYMSFGTGIPRHCKLECLATSKVDPESCCWNMKRSECKDDILKNFQREITSLLNVYLQVNRKKMVRLPLHCDRVLKAWCLENKEHPYMLENEALNLAYNLGLTVNQIKQRLENWRAKKWDPDVLNSQAGAHRQRQRQRKGIHFPHSQEDIRKLKDWAKRNGRHPNLNERRILSEKTSMSPKEIQTWSYNFRCKHKEETEHWNNI